MSDYYALVVGANGAIGAALVSQLAQDERCQGVYAVSRKGITSASSKVINRPLADYTDETIAGFCQSLKAEGVTLRVAVVATGVLHNPNSQMQPEKRLEDINAELLRQYFHTNSILPALWLKHLVKITESSAAHIACVSARVGSITDNRLGGWYGYRASKSALNMLMKTAQVEYKRRSPNTILVAYHPGTVDSKLSAPFQKNLPEGQLIDAETSASSLLGQLGEMDPEKAPYYVDWKSQSIPW